MELVGHELWSLVRPKDVWCSAPAKESASFVDKGSHGCVITHDKNIWPVGEAIDCDEELASCRLRHRCVRNAVFIFHWAVVI